MEIYLKKRLRPFLEDLRWGFDAAFILRRYRFHWLWASERGCALIVRPRVVGVRFPRGPIRFSSNSSAVRDTLSSVLRVWLWTRKDHSHWSRRGWALNCGGLETSKRTPITFIYLLSSSSSVYVFFQIQEKLPQNYLNRIIFYHKNNYFIYFPSPHFFDFVINLLSIMK